MSVSNSMLIGIKEIESQIDHTKPLEEKLLDAMKESHSNWLITNEDEQFRIAIGAVLSQASEEDRELINDELEAIRSINFAPDLGDLGGLFMLNQLPKFKIGLQKIWQESKKKPEPTGGFIQ